jgi:hypothetical protein
MGVLARLQLRTRVRIKLAPQIRSLQIRDAIGRSTVQQQTRLADVLSQLRYVECQMHRITCLRMRELKSQVRIGRQTHASAPQRDAGIGELTQRLPRIGGYEIGVIAHRVSLASACPNAAGSAADGWPSRVICMCSSQSANSGAGSKPCVRRKYSASWNEVL